jgi:Fe-S-cluster containining protein
MRDGPIRSAVKAIALACFTASCTLDRSVRRLRGERFYRLEGSCRGSGQCCESPAIRATWWLWYLPTLRRLFLWWQRAVNGLTLTETDRRGRVFIFRCGHFDPISRRCDSYSSRPGMCRDYPRVQLAQPNPELFPGCGYRLVAPNAEALRRALDGRGLTPEQMERLRRELHLKP